MKNLNTYITEAWSGVKKQSYEQEIKSWCNDMGIKNYTINSQGEIDVKGNVNLTKKDFKELPFKFGIVKGYFDMDYCKNLISLKNSPNYVEGYFSCDFCKKLISLKNCPDRVGRYFSCSGCSQLDSLEGCPNMVEENFWCDGCKRKFTKEEVKSLCKVKKENIYI